MMPSLNALPFFFVSLVSSTPDSTKDYYTAAVFQNAIVGPVDDAGGCWPLSNASCHGTPVEIANLKKFDSAMEKASAQGADIIVFGEGSVDVDLWQPGFWQQEHACEPIPDPDVVPCDAVDWYNFPITRNVSCMARAHKIVTVISICDRQPCHPGSLPCAGVLDKNCCPVLGYELFNTQVAFSEDGKVLAKYHKTHNYDTSPDSGETSAGLCCWPPRLDMKYFDTSFGVRFGMHICFDIMFRTPGIEMALDPRLGIHDFVYSTHWETTGPPMLPALEVQQSWSHALGVNLIAANAGLGYRHAGSGIYADGEALISHYNPLKARDDQLLVAKVPKAKSRTVPGLIRTDATRLFAPPVPAASSREFGVLATQQQLVQRVVVEADSFQCNLTAVLSNSTASIILDRFLLMAVNGSWMGKDNVFTRSCVVVRCGALSQADCLARASCADYTDRSCAGGRSLYNEVSDLEATTLFESITLEGSFKKDDIVLPMIGTSLGQPIHRSHIDFNGRRMHVDLHKPLLNAMLYGIPKENNEPDNYRLIV